VLWVGLTGGVGAGKSTVAAMLAARGAAVRDADCVVEELYRPGCAGAAAVVELFGPAVAARDGAVDRGALARIVLIDSGARRRLEAAIHPLVWAELARWRGSCSAVQAPPVAAVVEAALLVETGMHTDFDRLVVVSAPLALRRQRALSAGWSPEQFDRIVAAQTSDAQREILATDVIRNDSDEAALEANVAALWAEWAREAG